MDEELLGDPAWWRALPLAARLRGTPSLTAEDREYGRLRKGYWDSGALSGGRPVSLERWEQAGVDHEFLLDLLGEPAESLAGRLERPDYLSTLETAWTRYAHLPWSEPARVVDLVRPLVLWARDELAGHLAGLQTVHRAGAIPGGRTGRPTGGHSDGHTGGRTDRPTGRPPERDFGPLPPGHPLLDPPTDQFARMLAPTASLEINVAREEGRFRSGSAEENFTAFCEQLRDPANALRFLREYPVLAAELVAAARTWVEVRREFAGRFVHDLPELRATFGIECTGLAGLTEVRFGAGDSHCGGRSVAILGFADGRRLVYKPRGVDVEAGYNALLRWLNARGPAYEWKALDVLPRDGYGWVEFVPSKPCDRTDQIERFFWRQGAYLALFYALCGADLHHENVIATGEHPVIVDVEALFQATPRAFGLGDNEPLLNAAVKAARDSVLRVGMLPDHVIRRGATGAYGADISGLTGGGGQLSMLPVLVLRDRGTDRMRMTRERLPLNASANRALLGERPVDLAEYSAQLADGFADCYRLLLRHRAGLLAADGPLDAFGKARVRTLLRPTATYAKLLGESWHPDVLRDALDRMYLFESLSVALQGTDGGNEILASEIRQLLAQDIPLFDTTADGADLCDGSGAVIRDFFDRPGLDLARKRIEGLSETDLARQLWFIEASLTGLTVGEFHPARTATEPPAELPDEPLDRELARQAAEVVADLLAGSALDDEFSGTPSWLSVAFVGDRYWRVAPTGADLYSGLTGIALFLAELDALSPGRGYREPATRMTRHLCDLTDYLAGQEILVPTLGGGCFTGLAGLAYLFAELGRLWDEEPLTDRAYGLARDCILACETDKQSDVLGGIAGTALVFAGIHRRGPRRETLDLLGIVGQALAERRIDIDDMTAWPTDMETGRPLLGLSHGAGGIALALASIAELTGNGEYADLAVRALRYERSHLSAERGNWPDLRGFATTTAGPAYRDTWCHGAAGVGLVRAALLEMADRVPGLDEVRGLVTDDLETAVGTVGRDLIRGHRYVGLGNDSLCHGDLGLVETLHAASASLARPELDVLGRRCARVMAERVLAGELRCGTPDGLSTPGLMLGIAGIGYGLLRTSAPRDVPNLLLLAPPG